MRLAATRANVVPHAWRVRMLVKKAGCFGRPFPVMAAAAPLPVYERVAFDANVLFDSDKSALRPAGREKLDAFVSNIS